MGFGEKGRKRIWKNRIEIVNEENDWNHLTKDNTVEGPMGKIAWKKMATAIKAIEPGKVAGSTKVCTEIISTTGEVGISVMMKLGQRELHKKEMSDKWQTIGVVLNFQK